MLMRRRLCRGFAVVFLVLAADAALHTFAAVPARIIILRHGEKQDLYRLCETGVRRSLALRSRFLGKGAEESLFAVGEAPAAFFAITLHTLELATPAAVSWERPIHLYPVLPTPGTTEADHVRALNRQTQAMARALMEERTWDGTTVVVVWEHHHIAQRKLEQSFPGERVTLRQLLNLDSLGNVPSDWPDDVYDYFWIVTYGRRGSDRPTGFEMRKQVFPAPYQDLPSQDWGVPRSLPPGCLK
jgi:hypothetical protein